ncbi:hypothetical protein [Streptomyces sp. T21Q-yed]|uniref:hypothetical protein n=1 Tax=Streptomyces sp. T21Q-yed TaxID=3018441 RepID=UPI0023DEA797|nr:hypothetical protein [Streptomyces sp. T21Q-yed]MDF3141198.1 hypothetical protein [Streptomyces sp. T21Q-yed]
MLNLSLCLFGVLVAHGVHVESGNDVHHAAVATVPLFAAEADDHHGGHVPSQPGEHCAAGQPQQGSVLVSPCSAASVRASTGADDASTLRMSAAGRPIDGASPVALRAALVVQQT